MNQLTIPCPICQRPLELKDVQEPRFHRVASCSCQGQLHDVYEEWPADLAVPATPTTKRSK